MPRSQEFSKNDEVILEGGKKVIICEVEENTKIFCPFCDHTIRTHPNNTNAILNVNNAGQ